MATVNNRTKKVFSPILNGITAGGTIEIALQYGWDQTIESAADGLETPLRDKSGQFLRGTFQSTDWSLIISILTGTLDELVFSVRDSGVDEATGYTEHTIVNPVVHNVSLSIRKDQHATITAAFECRFASETATLLDVWSQSAGQSKPDTAVPAVGGHRILTTTFTPASGSAINIYHVTDFNFNLALQLSRECNDGDLGYTCVDALLRRHDRRRFDRLPGQRPGYRHARPAAHPRQRRRSGPLGQTGPGRRRQDRHHQRRRLGHRLPHRSQQQ